MKKQIYEFSVLLGMIHFMGCGVEVEGVEETVTGLVDQMSIVKNTCQEEGIDTKTELEKTLNSGGNNLSRACKSAIGGFDLSQLSLKVDMGFEARNPFNQVQGNSLYEMVSKDLNDQAKGIVSIGSLEESEFILKALDKETQAEVEIKSAYVMNELSKTDIDIVYTIDYSGSMYDEDIIYATTWAQKLAYLYPQSVKQIVRFSTDVTPDALNISSKAQLISETSYDKDYEQGATALYDAWKLNHNKLSKSEKPFKLHIVITDGAENASEETSKQDLIDLMDGSDVFTMVFASGFVDRSNLNDLTASNGLWFYQYEILSAQETLDDAQDWVEGLRVIKYTGNKFNELEGFRLEPLAN